VFGVDMPKTS